MFIVNTLSILAVLRCIIFEPNYIDVIYFVPGFWGFFPLPEEKSSESNLTSWWVQIDSAVGTARTKTSHIRTNNNIRSFSRNRRRRTSVFEMGSRQDEIVSTTLVGSRPGDRCNIYINREEITDFNNDTDC